MKEIRDKARDLMQGYCRVCVECNGRVCAGEVPGMGGLGSGSSFRNNIEALKKHTFNMRLLHEATEPDTSVDVLGLHLDLPVLAAPIGGVSFNMGGKISEEDYIGNKLRGCKQAGIIGCTGDGVPDFIHEAGFSAIKELDGWGIPFIKPWEDEELYAKLEKAAGTSASVFGMDIDAAGLVTLRKMGRPVSPKPVSKLREIIARTPGAFVLKGVMTEDEAKMAADAGASGIVVSNHGGRVLDHCPGTADVLPGIAQAIKGQLAIFVDGGIRSGADVLKMLALGADAVLVGRPFSVATIGGGAEGVASYVQQLKNELVQCMVLTGTQSAKDVSASILYEA